MRTRPRVFFCILALLVAGCAQDTVARYSTPATGTHALTAMRGFKLHDQSKISHVVIIFQENRTPDNLFHGLKGADIAEYGVQLRRHESEARADTNDRAVRRRSRASRLRHRERQRQDGRL